jgi:hypothetical protein
MYDYGTLKATEIILRRRRGRKENNAGDEPNLGTLYACMEMPHETSCATVIN